MTSSGAGDGATAGRARVRLLLPAGIFLLVFAMAVTIGGIPVAPLFRPGTFMILVAFLAIAVGAIARLAASPDGA